MLRGRRLQVAEEERVLVDARHEATAAADPRCMKLPAGMAPGLGCMTRGGRRLAVGLLSTAAGGGPRGRRGRGRGRRRRERRQRRVAARRPTLDPQPATASARVAASAFAMVLLAPAAHRYSSKSLLEAEERESRCELTSRSGIATARPDSADRASCAAASKRPCASPMSAPKRRSSRVAQGGLARAGAHGQADGGAELSRPSEPGDARMLVADPRPKVVARRCTLLRAVRAGQT